AAPSISESGTGRTDRLLSVERDCFTDGAVYRNVYGQRSYAFMAVFRRAPGVWEAGSAGVPPSCGTAGSARVVGVMNHDLQWGQTITSMLRADVINVLSCCPVCIRRRGKMARARF